MKYLSMINNAKLGGYMTSAYTEADVIRRLRSIADVLEHDPAFNLVKVEFSFDGDTPYTHKIERQP